MEDTMVIDEPAELEANAEDRGIKRKRDSIDGDLIAQDKGSLVAECHRELEDLFQIYKVVSNRKLHIENGTYNLTNSVIACLLEESNLPISKLVEEIYEKLKEGGGITLSFLHSTVLSIGKRKMYGMITNGDANVLEDDSESCLWCWEAIDVELLPTDEQGILNLRRKARNVIHARVSALSEILSALSAPESHESCKSALLKVSVKLGKVLQGEGIRSLIEKIEQWNGADIAVKKAKLKEKELIKEMERSILDAEKEKKRILREIEKDKCRSEKEFKRLQEEVRKEERRREKVVVELKKQQEAAERDQQRRKKEEDEVKKKRALQKQASIMEKFLKIRRNSDSDKPEQGLSSNGPVSDSSCKKEYLVNTTTTSMDLAMRKQGIHIQELRKSHIHRWRKLCDRSRSCRWGVRCKPKTELIKELKLRQSSFEAEPLEKSTTPITGPALEECLVTSQPYNIILSPSVRPLKRKLLQFHNSYRPAFYGTCYKKSVVVRPQNPIKKDPNLDYNVDSDEEWEEEDPGESLSDCDKDIESDDDEKLKVEGEDEDDDSFVVPDGYLSENEGIEVDGPSEGIRDEASNLENESKDFKALTREQRYLQSLTEKSLKKNKPLIILNLMHEKAELAMAEDLNGTPYLELTCLQALQMQAFPVIDTSVNLCLSNDDQEVGQSQSRGSSTSTATAASIPDSDLLEFVRCIQTSPNGIDKVVESLQYKFPAFTKKQLKNTVREVSDFVDNRWQVKKEILSKLGLLNLTGDKGGNPKGIERYFSIRGSPRGGESSAILDSSPQPCSKTEAHPGDNGGSPQTYV